jgi:hypothetical protein
MYKCTDCGKQIKENVYQFENEFLCQSCYETQVRDEKIFSDSYGWLSFEDIMEGFEYTSETERIFKKIK